MATTYPVSTGDFMRPLGKCRIKWYPEDAAQSFKLGEPLIAGAAGVENKVKVASDNPTGSIVGVAAADASGVTGAMVPVWVAEPHQLFVARTVAGDGLDYTDLGNARAIQAHGTLTTTWVVDTSDAGNDSVTPRYYRSPTGAALAEGDLEMEVVFTFIPGATVWGSDT